MNSIDFSQVESINGISPVIPLESGKSSFNWDYFEALCDKAYSDPASLTPKQRILIQQLAEREA